MMLEQIERNQKELQDAVDKAVTKTVGVALPIRLHSRMWRLIDKSNPSRKTMKSVALSCIEAGLDRLEEAS